MRAVVGTLGGVTYETSAETSAAESPFRTEPTARDLAPQFVLPLVVRIERAAPPARTDALETAARAVLVLLDAEWRRAEALDGITVTGATAEVRVFPPVPLAGWPKDLAKLQVSGTDLDDPEPPAPPAPDVPVLWFNPGLEMSAGKAMAQAGHGAQLAWWDLTDEQRAAWRDAGFPLRVRTAAPAQWQRLTDSGLPVVRDAGFTEIAPGSCTVVADHPALRQGS